MMPPIFCPIDFGTKDPSGWRLGGLPIGVRYCENRNLIPICWISGPFFLNPRPIDLSSNFKLVTFLRYVDQECIFLNSLEKHFHNCQEEMDNAINCIPLLKVTCAHIYHITFPELRLPLKTEIIIYSCDRRQLQYLRFDICTKIDVQRKIQVSWCDWRHKLGSDRKQKGSLFT